MKGAGGKPLETTNPDLPVDLFWGDIFDPQADQPVERIPHGLWPMAPLIGDTRHHRDQLPRTGGRGWGLGTSNQGIGVGGGQSHGLGLSILYRGGKEKTGWGEANSQCIKEDKRYRVLYPHPGVWSFKEKI